MRLSKRLVEEEVSVKLVFCWCCVMLIEKQRVSSTATFFRVRSSITDGQEWPLFTSRMSWLMFCLVYPCHLEQPTSSSLDLLGFKKEKKESSIWRHLCHGTATTSALSLSWFPIMRLPQLGSWWQIFWSLRAPCCRLRPFLIRTSTT